MDQDVSHGAGEDLYLKLHGQEPGRGKRNDYHRRLGMACHGGVQLLHSSVLVTGMKGM